MALGTGWKEIERSYDRGAIGTPSVTGVRRYVGPKGAQELVSVQHLDTLAWTTPESVVLYPVKLRILANAREGGNVGGVDCSEIEVLYRSTYNPKKYPVGKATQEMYTTQDTRKLLYDLSAATGTATQSGTTVTWVSGDKFHKANVGSTMDITGGTNSKITAFTDETHVTVVANQTVNPAAAFIIPARPIETRPDKDGYFYAVETGTNIVLDPRVIFVIRTAIIRASVNYLTLATYAGKGNDAAFSKIGGGLPKHQALCLKVAVAKDFIDDGTEAYIPLMFVFGYYDFDLDNWCTARRMRLQPKDEAILDRTDDTTSASTRVYKKPDNGTTDNPALAKTRTTMKPVPAAIDDDGAGNENKIRECIEYADFSAIDALVTWG